MFREKGGGGLSLEVESEDMMIRCIQLRIKTNIPQIKAGTYIRPWLKLLDIALSFEKGNKHDKSRKT